MDNKTRQILDELKAKELYYEEAKQRFEILRAFVWEFFNLQISLVPPGFVNHSMKEYSFDVIDGKIIKRLE